MVNNVKFNEDIMEIDTPGESANETERKDMWVEPIRFVTMKLMSLIGDKDKIERLLEKTFELIRDGKDLSPIEFELGAHGLDNESTILITKQLEYFRKLYIKEHCDEN